MINKLNKLMTNTRYPALRQFGVGLASTILVGLVGLLARPAAADPAPATSTAQDLAEDAVFPSDLFNAPVPPYLDMVSVSISSRGEVFHFEIQVNAKIPANADPGFTPGVNHLGPTVGILTDRKTATHFKFFGQTDVYCFNFLVGALYSVADSGLGLGLGWRGFLIDLNTFATVEIPLQIRGDTLVFETSAASLGNPESFDWVAGSECDPVSNTDEKNKSTILVDFVPDHGFATWAAPGL